MDKVEGLEDIVVLNQQDRALVNLAQRYQPSSARPYLELARQLALTEEEVLARLQNLRQQGVLSRYGAVFHHTRAGHSTLVAMAVPEDSLGGVVDYINNRPAVNHNYLREHHFNIWFVLTAADESQVAEELHLLASRFPYPILDLPMEQSYFIDLGFPL